MGTLNLVLLFSAALWGGGQSEQVSGPGGHGYAAKYTGGTSTTLRPKCSGTLRLADGSQFRFTTDKADVSVPYPKINIVEYGQKVERRYVLAILISPLFLLAKSRRHFVTIGFADEQGIQQALVFQVGKAGIRPVLVSLEARTGLVVKYQDEEARRAGKG